MDNLKLMHQLESDSIDLIYSDILYGTGRDFGDFTDIASDKDTIYKFYEPRLKEMYRLVRDSGAIALQMDYRIVHWIRCMCEDLGLFLVNDIIWHYKKFSQNNNRSFIRNHDYILVFAKSDNYVFNPQYRLDKDKQKRMSRGYFNCGGKRILVYDEKKFNKWAKTKDNIDEYTLVDRTDEEPTIRRDDVFNDFNFINSQSKERVGYETQKPIELLEVIIKAYSDEGDVVADFFCGSGTAGVVAKKLGRDYIMCDINEKAIEITESRIRKLK